MIQETNEVNSWWSMSQTVADLPPSSSCFSLSAFGWQKSVMYGFGELGLLQLETSAGLTQLTGKIRVAYVPSYELHIVTSIRIADLLQQSSLCSALLPHHLLTGSLRSLSLLAMHAEGLL